MSMKYCGIKRRVGRLATTCAKNRFNKDNEPYTSLGEKIRASLEYGSDVGSPVPVQYDPSDMEDVDVMTSPDHDFFDIAEEFGSKTATNPLPKGDDDKTE